MPFCDHANGLHVVVAGNGNPYAVLTIPRLRLLHAMHDGASADELARALDLDPDVVHSEIAPLVDFSLVVEDSDIFRANVLVATEEETRRVDAHASALGLQLAERLVGQREALQHDYEKLDVSGQWSFDDLAFLLVGDRILDVGLLDALARDGTLMPSAPARPSPTQPDARYYFWLIEGEHDLLGKYGQRVTSLPVDGWDLLTFGQYTIGDEVNTAREEVERSAIEFLTASPNRTPQDLARVLQLPSFDRSDTARWGEVAQRQSEDLLSVYLEARPSLDDLFHSLTAASAPGTSFGEFFCWYDHVAYAHAIDALDEAGMLTIPDERFTAALWQESPETVGF
jgi:hypothetical protein